MNQANTGSAQGREPEKYVSSREVEPVGFDPYDALNGERVPDWIRSRRRMRQALIQLRKRCPLNLAPLLGVKPFFMAKAAGCFLTAEARLWAAQPDVDLASTPADASEAAGLSRSRHLIQLMEGTVGDCEDGSWGYEFDVQTRWAYYAGGSPNLIATFFVGRGLADAGASFRTEEWAARGSSAAEFIFAKLRRSTAEGCPFFAYTPDSPRLVHNANLLGAGLVASAGALHDTQEWRSAAMAAATTSLAAQRPDGSWPYGEGSGLGWSDNFHTAYNLDGLLSLWLATGDPGVREGLERGTEHWTRDFFGPSGEPKYFPHKALPFDIHSAATAIDVASRLATWGFPTEEVALRVADWTRRDLIEPNTGRTYYRKHRFFVDHRCFVRWGEAHWTMAQASLRLLGAGRRSPLESAVFAARPSTIAHSTGGADVV